MGLAESNESRLMGERTRPLSPHDITSDVPSFNGAPLSQQLRCSVRHMKSNSKIQIKSRGRSQSVCSEKAERDCRVRENENIYGDEADPLVNAIDETAESVENLERLEKQIRLEKERTEQYLSELLHYLNTTEQHAPDAK